MTTVAFDGTTMACDSCWAYGDVVDSLATKIERLSSGALLGMAGESDGRFFSQLLDKIKLPTALPSHAELREIRQDVEALLVLPKHGIFKLITTAASPTNWDFDSGGGVGVWPISGPFAAIGSGANFALVAMRCGKNARDAVRIACDYDLYSRGPVHSLSLSRIDDNKKKKTK